MKRIRYTLLFAVAMLLFGVGANAHAERYNLSFGVHGVLFGYQSGHDHHGYQGHFNRRHYYNQGYRGHPRRWDHPGYRRHPRYWRKYRHRRHGHYGWRY
ncbi:MAG: hypothetical protein MAG794_01552 [Gammaproteobacteria bacterium]|nr:hypothetical protein [Gammaproteobacteria bacterium]